MSNLVELLFPFSCPNFKRKDFEQVCSVSKYCSWQTFDRNASLDTKVLLVPDLVSAVSGTQEQGSVVMSQTTISQPCVPPLGELMSLTKVCRLLPVPSQMQKAECRMLEGTLLPSPLADVFQTHHPFHSVLWNPFGFPSYQYMIWILESLFSAVLKISLFILFFESVMVVNKNWSLVYSATEFFPTKLYVLLPIF